MTGAGPDPDEPWPELPWRSWAPTVTTLHLWTQIVGKVRMALAPPLNHWWHVTLQVTARGLTSGPLPYDGRSFQVDLDLAEHALHVVVSGGGSFTMPLEPRSVASFYEAFMGGLQRLGIEVRIWPRPVEVAVSIPFARDDVHAAYDPDHAHRLWLALMAADRVMRRFQSGYVGKASPVHFFWGSFDLAATRYSGRPAPLHPGGAPNCPAWVMEEAYSREEISVGWWPSSEPPGPAFYAYAYPEPAGFGSALVRPVDAFFDARRGEFLLPYDVVRRAPDPDGTVLAFLQAAYEAGAELGAWDRSALEPAVMPGPRPRRPWSVTPSPHGATAGSTTHRHGGRHVRRDP